MINYKSFRLWRTYLGTEYRTYDVKKISTRIEPVKMSFTSYESASDSNQDSPLIIMHGLFGSKSNWNSLSKSLHNLTNRKVISVDARNHGDSPHSEKHTYAHMVEDIKLLMDDLGLKKASMIGHSMGGRTMMYFAIIYPDLVESLIPVDISPINHKIGGEGLSSIRNIINALSKIDTNLNMPISKARLLIDDQLSSSIESPVLRQFLLVNLIQVNNHYTWRVNLNAIDSNFDNDISVFPEVNSTYNGPTFFIGGGLSKFLIHENHDAIRKIFPNAKFEYISDAGHWLHAEKPNEFLKLVTEFLATH
ncbi:protein ABHD11-like [Daktulosphaira vitifoliae]|uniref:protein ABHD11-like n=1 Tax=Daktulosphaira vitifoliae TaxID=58002 RepID=UPI0021AACF46|nr:protein ABHD11-like [Daktulosphaira vitifoliae]